MSTVSIVPGASRQKLPFVHSKFKARSKFAKSFGGCSRFVKSRAAGNGESASDVKLPRITYNASDSRTVLAFGSNRRGGRKEYPGFAGFHRKNTKVQPSNNNVTSPGRNSDDFTGHDKFSDRSLSRGDLVIDSSRSSVSSKDGTHSSNVNSDDHLPPLNSLFIIDEVSFEGSASNPGLARKDLDSDDARRQKEALKRQEDSVFQNDPFAREFGDKLKDSRGKSGVKRTNKIKGQNRRTLGDIMTTKRLQELLSPRQTGVPLKFG
ncbi:uncharacterized protein LOC101846592 [Aplysia californica]|uniref:Uncharacterized protein LOC101846592 n=1 Tax=Aplysia californica TaxID=6500 RepID=A0ABM0JUX4_APLCA|nr:uncharacterized protein LOC101846592 [Aplysia californica]XP_005102098.1 uncharacterized protein LOC101846592 [Aplysia californica]XP_035826596.1 uncharacterized protein LOC101846592 [Aplysia californica]